LGWIRSAVGGGRRHLPDDCLGPAGASHVSLPFSDRFSSAGLESWPG
jgi:hypothetical protein